MCRIERVAASYRRNGHVVRILNRNRIQVTDRVAGNIYRVSAAGRAIVGTELARELAREEEEPNYIGPE